MIVASSKDAVTMIMTVRTFEKTAVFLYGLDDFNGVFLFSHRKYYVGVEALDTFMPQSMIVDFRSTKTLVGEF